jgi:hypothetical protein
MLKTTKLRWFFYVKMIYIKINYIYCKMTKYSIIIEKIRINDKTNTCYRQSVVFLHSYTHIEYFLIFTTKNTTHE